MPRLSILLAALLLPAGAGEGQDGEVRRDLIHSDLPLWPAESETTWPRAFNEGDSFGCASRLRYGDWKLQESADDAGAHWYRITNYGVFHCFMLVRDADTREALAGHDPNPSFLIELGRARAPGGEVELWALQRGTVPGSSYLLLSSRPGSGAISRLDVLQRRCPDRLVRDRSAVSILITRYCAINDRAELIGLARRMAQLPPLGTLTLDSSATSE